MTLKSFSSYAPVRVLSNAGCESPICYNSPRHHDSCAFDMVICRRLVRTDNLMLKRPGDAISQSNFENVFPASVTHRSQYSRCKFGQRRNQKPEVRTQNSEGNRRLSNPLTRALQPNRRSDARFTGIEGGCATAGQCHGERSTNRWAHLPQQTGGLGNQ